MLKPLLFSPISARTFFVSRFHFIPQVKVVLFFDAGQTVDPSINANYSIKTDVGFGLRWFSPIGPLRFEWGFPLGPLSPGDSATVFQFFIGPPF